MNKQEQGIVQFKSVPEMWLKEWSGKKPNTFRKIDEEDERFKLLRKGCPVIRIKNSENEDFFTREITDYTEWDGFAIISWGS